MKWRIARDETSSRQFREEEDEEEEERKRRVQLSPPGSALLSYDLISCRPQSLENILQPPEYLEGCRLSKKGDVYSYSFLLYEMIARVKGNLDMAESDLEGK